MFEATYVTIPPIMRIAITHTRFSYTGGIEKYIYSLVERLLAADHEVHYLAARWEPLDHPRLHFHAVPWIRFPHSLRVSSFDRGVRRILARERFDLVHGFTKTSVQDVYTDGSGTWSEYLAATRPDEPRWKDWLYRHSPHQRAILHMEQARFRRGAILKIIPMAEFVREQILREYAVEPGRVETLYNGVEIERFHPRLRATEGARFRRDHGIPAEARVLLFVGNDFRRKGLETALRSLRSVAERVPTVRLAVAGHDNHPERYRALAETLGVGSRVDWLGSVREVPHAFAASDIFVFPTRYDVFGNVGLEALSTGVPAVLSARAGVAELLLPRNARGHERAGWRLEDPSDADELTRATLTLLTDDSEGRAHHARALAEHYSWDRHFERLLEIYREVIAEKRGR
ncbi:MAG: glycosyltransferase family 4 protein, partial [Planctomycetes bacterium]|nr:glycosyltransferase family 4 protein [Planctomycetota bacterium]